MKLVYVDTVSVSEIITNGGHTFSVQCDDTNGAVLQSLKDQISASRHLSPEQKTDLTFQALHLLSILDENAQWAPYCRKNKVAVFKVCYPSVTVNQ